MRRSPLAASPPCAAALCAAILSGCGGGGGGPTPASAPGSPTAVPTPVRSPSPSPTPADVQRAEITQSYLATYLETTYPVVIVRNASRLSSVTALTVHFSVRTPAGVEVAQSDAQLSGLGPGVDSALAARIGVAAQGDQLVATVAAATFGLAAPAVWRVEGVVLACDGCAASGGGSGDVRGRVTATKPAGPVNAQAACFDATGHLLGGGATVISSPAPGSPIDVPVIVDGAAQTCRIDVGPSSF